MSAWLLCEYGVYRPLSSLCLIGTLRLADPWHGEANALLLGMICGLLIGLVTAHIRRPHQKRPS